MKTIRYMMAALCAVAMMVLGGACGGDVDGGELEVGEAESAVCMAQSMPGIPSHPPSQLVPAPAPNCLGWGEPNSCYETVANWLFDLVEFECKPTPIVGVNCTECSSRTLVWLNSTINNYCYSQTPAPGGGVFIEECPGTCTEFYACLANCNKYAVNSASHSRCWTGCHSSWGGPDGCEE